MHIKIGSYYRVNFVNDDRWIWRVDELREDGRVLCTIIKDPRSHVSYGDKTTLNIKWLHQNTIEISSFKQQLKELL